MEDVINVNKIVVGNLKGRYLGTDEKIILK
jgi:hypothetical protein